MTDYNPTDRARWIRGLEGGRFVVAGISEDREVWAATGEGHALNHPVTLDSGVARRFAAHLLDLADEVDGVTSLVYMPECPKCEAEALAGTYDHDAADFEDEEQAYGEDAEE